MVVTEDDADSEHDSVASEDAGGLCSSIDEWVAPHILTPRPVILSSARLMAAKGIRLSAVFDGLKLIIITIYVGGKRRK